MATRQPHTPDDDTPDDEIGNEDELIPLDPEATLPPADAAPTA